MIAMFSEPSPPKPHITATQQRQIIRAALAVLHPSIHEIKPNPNDDFTLAQHLELALIDAMQDTYAADAVPRLFRDMSEAALSELIAISPPMDE